MLFLISSQRNVWALRNISTLDISKLSKHAEPILIWEKYSSYTKLQQDVCFLLRCLPKHKLCGIEAKIVSFDSIQSVPG